MISRERRIVTTTNGTHPWSSVTQILTVEQVLIAIVKRSKCITSTYPLVSTGPVVSLITEAIYQGNSDMNHTSWNIASTERIQATLRTRHIMKTTKTRNTTKKINR